jgi:putative membrane protein
VTVIRFAERYPTLYSARVTDSIELVLRRFIVTWFFNIVAIWVAAKLVDGVGYGNDEWILVVAALVFSIVNIFVKPLVILFTLPLVILTLGIALFFVNLLMLYLTSWIVDDFSVDSFGAAILATIIVWAVNTLLEAVFSYDDRRRAGDREVLA